MAVVYEVGRGHFSTATTSRRKMETDLVLEAVVRSASASDAVGLCSRLLRQESTGLSAVTALLERIRLGMEEEAGIRVILQGIRGACAPPSAVCDQLLQLLPLINPPTAVVEALPHFVGDDPSDVSRVVAGYKELLSGDRSLLVHIVGSLHDLPLDADTRAEVSAMTLEALSIVDEEDMPVVVRTLFKTARERESTVVISRVRAECSELSMSTLAVLMDVIANAFFINETTARAFLTDITDSLASAAALGSRSLFESGSSSGGAFKKAEGGALSTMDVIGLLLLMSHRRHVLAVRALLDKLYRKPELIPTDIVVSLAKRSGESPWACLANPVRELGLWAAIGSARPRLRTSGSSSSSGGSGGGLGDETSIKSCRKALLRLRRAGARILMAVFEGQPSARGPIVSCCLAVVGTYRLPPTPPPSPLLVPTCPGKEAEREKGIVAADALLESCSGALDLLLHLSNSCAALMSPFANAVADLVLGGAGRSLHPLLLDKAAGCLAAMMRHTNVMVNEIMNHVQKQVFFLGAGVGGVEIGGRLAGGGGSCGGTGGLYGGFQNGVGGVDRSGDHGARRRSAIVLATHLIRGGVLEEHDADALLGWAVRLLSLLRCGMSSLDTVAITLELLVTATSDRPFGAPALLERGGGTADPRIGSYYRGGSGSGCGGSSNSNSSSLRVGGQRRDAWARAGASTAGRCLIGMGILRMVPDTRGSSAVQLAVSRGGDEELVPSVARPIDGLGVVGDWQRENSSAPVVVLRARDIALTWWREGPWSMSESARSLHRSWLAALMLSAQNSSASGASTSPADASNSVNIVDDHCRRSNSNSSRRPPALGALGSDSCRRATDAVETESWVRAWLSMPVWPFSEGLRRVEGSVEDAGGYWGWARGRGGAAGGYDLWSIPPTKCAWQGIEATQRLVEAGAACVSARALLSATARHLMLLSAASSDCEIGQGCSAMGKEPSDEEEEAAVSDGIVWRYLELGVRGRACAFALRHAARELRGSRVTRSKGTVCSSKKDGPRALLGTLATEELDAAVARLEEGLNVELMPLECLCRLVNVSSETRVAVMTVERDNGTDKDGCGDAVTTIINDDDSGNDGRRVPSSIDFVAYTELLRTVTTRLSGTSAGTVASGAGMRTAPLELGTGGGGASKGALTEAARAEGLRTLDLGALFRGAEVCSRALPVVRKFLPTLNRPAKTGRNNSPGRGSTPRKRTTRGEVGGGGDITVDHAGRPRSNTSDTRRTSSVGGRCGAGRIRVEWCRSQRRDKAPWRRSSGGVSKRFSGAGWREDDGGEGSDAVFSEGRSEDSEWDSGEGDDGASSEEDASDDDNFHEDENDDEEEFQLEEASTRLGKKRKTPRGGRQSGQYPVSGSPGLGGGREKDGDFDPCQGPPGLSLCQFWRYRLLLEVVLAARVDDEDRWEEKEGERRDIGAGPRMTEVMERLRVANDSWPTSVPGGKAAAAAAAGMSGEGGNGTAGYWVFSELSHQLERAEDGLLAGVIVELLSVLSTGLGRSQEAAALAWKGLSAVYPRGWGIGYSHLGGVIEGLWREGTTLLASPMSLRLFLQGGDDGVEGAKESFSRLRGQLIFSPQLGNASLMSKAGLPSPPFLRHAFLSHWALAGRMGRGWALAAAVIDIEAFLLGASAEGPRSSYVSVSAKKNTHHGNNNDEGDDEGENGYCSHKNKKGADICPSSSSVVLCQENFDVFLGTVVKLLLASIALATPSAVVAANPWPAERTGSDTTGPSGGDTEAWPPRGWQKRGRVPEVSRSPYEEAECLGMVLECLVEACTESLEAEAWAASSKDTDQLVALGRLLRRCVLPIARCCSQALRALEGQLERSLTWRCRQAPAPVRDRQGGRPRAPISPARTLPLPGDIQSRAEEDCGAPGLCRGLLEQCDLCADGARALCAAVHATATCSLVLKGKEQGEGVNASFSSPVPARASQGTREPHRVALNRVNKIIPGIALQSDQLSTAVDKARQVLQLPRSSAAADRTRGELDRKSTGQKRRRGSSERYRRASERLSSLFVSHGGGMAPDRVSASTGRVSGRRKPEKRPLSLRGDLRGWWSRTKISAKFIGRGNPTTSRGLERAPSSPHDRLPFEPETLGRRRVYFRGGDVATITDNMESEEKDISAGHHLKEGEHEGAADEAFGLVGDIEDQDLEDEEDEEVDQFRVVGGGWGLC